MTAVEVEGLTKHFGDVRALAGVDMRVPVGRVHGLLGPNGAGKTTLLRVLFGLIRPDGGTVRVLGRTPDKGDDFREGVAGFVESPSFYPYLSGRRNLELLAKLDGGAAAAKVDEVIEHVGLALREKDKVGGYSLGMRQRLGIAAALLRAPRLLVLDEPANGLDPAGIRDMRALLRGLGESGFTVLLSSHNMDEVESLCESVTIMRTGQVVHDGSIEDLRAQAPAPAHCLRTADDHQALELARTQPTLSVAESPDGGLSIRADQEELDAYTFTLFKAGIAIRELRLLRTSLESLFSMLTEAPDQSAGGADR
ncbi:MAG TPA: ABC transporter ATP-binding protein [Amycolatopsis sp.]|uniref:ABC transporter ATP-binding protein n=1 Tax=Amycolatopsis sp. TaxID=37632 RepID=UPI002B48B834|nr:ABC transporter ATP-binding protein [Amycolatopsis sp.]HKS50052.1 ABC transporter ATP-binding protein [Amycolatopsis sp.]